MRNVVSEIGLKLRRERMRNVAGEERRGNDENDQWSGHGRDDTGHALVDGLFFGERQPRGRPSRENAAAGPEFRPIDRAACAGLRSANACPPPQPRLRTLARAEGKPPADRTTERIVIAYEINNINEPTNSANNPKVMVNLNSLRLMTIKLI